jgi:hypothetical protein
MRLSVRKNGVIDLLFGPLIVRRLSGHTGMSPADAEAIAGPRSPDSHRAEQRVRY